MNMLIHDLATAIERDATSEDYTVDRSSRREQRDVEQVLFQGRWFTVIGQQTDRVERSSK